jgi:lysophospholipase L1-like esterase
MLSGLVLSLTLAAGVSTPLRAGNEKDYTYLALGDSVSFGLNVTLFTAPQLPTPWDFAGYPETVAALEHLLQSKKLVNASCPGESSSSFVSPGAPDYGCHSMGPDGEPPFKSWIGLRADYPGTQLAFATEQLSSNKHINLVTLSIGANDFLMIARDCATNADPKGCVGARLPGMLQTYGANLVQILTAMRTGAGYKGTIVLVGYYAPIPDLIPIAQYLNGTMQEVGANFGVKYADGLAAYEAAAAAFGGDVCQAGLLIRLNATTCDIHPSAAGSNVLAAAVLAAIGDLK